MAILTHHISDRNVLNLNNGTAMVERGFDGGELMEVTASGYLQPPPHQRAERLLLAFAAGWVMLFLRWVVSGSYDIDTFFELGDGLKFPTLNLVLALMAIAVWLSAAHMLIFQNVHTFGGIAGWPTMNSVMMAIYFIVVGLMTVIYIGMAVKALLDLIDDFLSRDKHG